MCVCVCVCLCVCVCTCTVKKIQAVSTNYYLVTSSTEILRNVLRSVLDFWLQSVIWIVIFLVGSSFTELVLYLF